METKEERERERDTWEKMGCVAQGKKTQRELGRGIELTGLGWVAGKGEIKKKNKRKMLQ